MPTPAEEALLAEEALALQEEEKRKAAELEQQQKQTPKITPEMQAELDALGLEGVEIDAEGLLVLKVDPNNPNSSVYKGKTAKEVLGNMIHGIKAKDDVIERVKAGDESALKVRKQAQEKVAPAKPQAKAGETVVEDDAPIELELPSYDDIIKSVYTGAKVDMAMRAWGKKEWQDFELEHGATETVEMRTVIRQLEAKAEAQCAEADTIYINNDNLLKETEAVEELLREYQIDPKDIDYTKILEKVEGNPANFTKNGVRKPGTIVKEATRVIKGISDKLVAKNTEDRINAEIADGKRQKPHSPAPASPKGSYEKQPGPAPASTGDAVDQILKEMKAGRKFE